MSTEPSRDDPDRHISTATRGPAELTNTQKTAGSGRAGKADGPKGILPPRPRSHKTYHARNHSRLARASIAAGDSRSATLGNTTATPQGTLFVELGGNIGACTVEMLLRLPRTDLAVAVFEPSRSTVAARGSGVRSLQPAAERCARARVLRVPC